MQTKTPDDFTVLICMCYFENLMFEMKHVHKQYVNRDRRSFQNLIQHVLKVDCFFNKKDKI